MAEHTPTPWHFEELEHRPDGCGYIRHETDRFEISHHGDTGRTREENLANAALIVKAVNSHDALVNALQNARRYINAVIVNTPDKKKRRNFGDCLRIIDAALAKVSP